MNVLSLTLALSLSASIVGVSWHYSAPLRLHSDLKVQAQTVMEAMEVNMAFYVGANLCMTDPGNHELSKLKALDYLSPQFESDWTITTSYAIHPPRVTYRVHIQAPNRAKADELKAVAPRFGYSGLYEAASNTLILSSAVDNYLDTQGQINRYNWSTGCFVDPY